MVRRPKWIVGLVMSGAAVAGLLTAISPSSAAQEVRLTAAGDYGARAATVTVLDEIARISPDAHLAVGDLSYRDSIDEYAWCGFVKQRVGEGFPFQLVSGNHESLDVNDGEINNFSACLPNQIPGVVGTYGREYYMDFPKGAPLVRVIQTSPYLTFLDGRWTYTQGDAHYNWLAAAIDDGRAKGAKWIIVTSHFPCQSVGTYNCSTPRDFYNLLLAKRVDLVLHGHEHSYARTHQLRSGVTGCTTVTVGTFDPDCVADSDNAFMAGEGSVFATVGTGGTPLRNVNAADTEAGYFAAWSGLNSNPTYGLLDISVTDAQLTASFVPTSGGDFTDAFTITRDVNLAPVASFSATPDGLSVDVDASLSSDSDGTVTGYSWDFGDANTSVVGPVTSHTYAVADTYTVTLTVTDDDGATSDVASQQVTVDAPLSAVVLVSVTPGAGSVALDWDAPVSDGGSPVTSYSVYRSESGSGFWSYATGTGPGVTQASVVGLTAGVSYDFRVYARNAIGFAPPSNVIAATVL
jgi:PKD repeat protein